MAEKSVFEQLAQTLSEEDREHLLGAIRKNMESALAPVGPPPEGAPLPIPEQIKELNLWGRFRLFVAQIFSGANRDEVITRWSLSALRNQVNRVASPDVDAQRRVLTDNFAAWLEKLQLVMVRSSALLDEVAANRPEVVFRLAAGEFPGINRDLLHRTSERYLEQQDERNERVLKHNLTVYLDERLADIPSRAAAKVRLALAQIDQLVLLGHFSFSSMVGAFSGSAEEGNRQCAFDYVSHSLEKLVKNLARLSEPLERNALETLILVAYDRERHDTEEEFQNALSEGFSLLEQLLATVREFSRQYPLKAIVRIVREDPWWEPDALQGNGNDWLSIYRGKLDDRINREVLRVSLHRQMREQITILEEILGVQAQPFEGLPDGSDGVFVTHYHAAMVVWSFSGALQRNTMTALRMVLNGAEFYKSSNRAQYNDAFNDYEQIPAKIRQLRDMIIPGADWGQALHSGPSRERRQEMAYRVDEELYGLVRGIRINLETMTNLLGGILYARPGSPYDTIANYGQIGGRRNSELIEEIKQIHSDLRRIDGVIGEVDALEDRARDHEMYLRPAT